MNKEELKYYGSELNKFIAKNCRRDMTVMNIDLITYDRDKRHIRIIESKHLHESIGKGQRNLLRVLHEIFKRIVNIKITVFIIRGNPPYNWVYLENVIDGSKKKINKEQLIKFLNYE